MKQPAAGKRIHDPEKLRFLFMTDDISFHPDFDSVKVIYVQTGIAEIRTGMDTIRLTKDSVLLCNEESYQCRVLEKDTVIQALFIGKEYFHQHIFNPIWADRFFTEFMLCVSVPEHRSFHSFTCVSTEENRIGRALLELRKELENDMLCSINARDCLLFLVLIRIAREYEKQFGRVAWSKHIAYHSLLLYLDSNYQTTTLEETAAHFGFSPSYLSKFLKKTTGKTFIEHIHDRRLDAASEILLHTDLPVRKTAHIVGYQNVSYFYRMFKRYYDCTPEEYRNRTSGQ